MTIKLRIVCAGLAAIALAGCGGGGSSYNNPGPGPGPGPGCSQSVLANLFGCGFGTLFAASANSDPAEPDPNGIIAVDLTKDPVAVP